MGILREIPPTAGIPIFADDLWAVLAGKLPGVSFETALNNRLGLPYGRLTSSGTAALYLILETLKTLSAKRTVVIPSYICTLVPIGIARAGLKVEVCDITGKDFNFDMDELERICNENDDVLAIVAGHIGGIPADIGSVRRVASSRGIYVIEDCAQALGASCTGRPVGTLGDFAFFSLGVGKGLTIFEGGFLTTSKNELTSHLDSVMTKLLRQKPLAESLKVFQLLGYGIFYRPETFWFFFKLPQKFWLMIGDRVKANLDYYTDFPLQKISRLRQSIGLAGLGRVDGAIKAQREKASYIMNGLKDVKGIGFIKESSGDMATYPFVTVIFDEGSRRERVLSALQKTGLGADRLYLSAITDFDYISDIVPQKPVPGGRSIASRILTLSTSVYLETRDLDVVIETIKKS